LFGYVTLAEKLYKKRLNNKYESWNFAPHKDSFLKVRKLIELFQSSKYLKKQKIKIVYKKKVSKFKETNILKLDFKKSFITLKWKPRFTIKETVNLILQWNQDTQKKAFYLEACKKQIFHYLTK
jgi:CDP-glucose 4,6-dehydratase